MQVLKFWGVFAYKFIMNVFTALFSIKISSSSCGL